MSSITVEELTKVIMEQAKEKGWGLSPEDFSVPQKIASLHSQISSAYEGWRKGNMTGPWSIEDELAGAIQRIIHLGASLGLDLEKAMLFKLEENKDRTWDWKESRSKSE